MISNPNIIKYSKSLSIPPPPPTSAEPNKGIKMVQRVSPTINTLNFIINNKDINKQKIMVSQEARDTTTFNKAMVPQGDVNRKSSVGSGVSCGISASTAAEGEWSTERLQDVGSDEVSVTSNDEYSASKDKNTFFVKLLVSNQLAGMLIGTSGQEIKALKEKTGAKVVLSPHGKYFPGTSERLVVLEGTQETVFEAMEWIVNKVVEMPPAETTGSTKPACRICVPRAVVGSLIGKNGSYIQYVRMTTGAHVHVSPLFVSADEACAERVVTIQSRERDSLRMAAFTVLKKINEHPSNSACRNISYMRKSDYSLDAGSSDTSSLVSSNSSNSAQFQSVCPPQPTINNLFSAEVSNSAADSSEGWGNASYIQTYSPLQHHKNSESTQSNIFTLTPLNNMSHALQSHSSAMPLMLGPPPGLSSCNTRVSSTVARNSWDNVYLTNNNKSNADIVRMYNREVSAETESTQCSLNANNSATNVNALLSDAERSNNEVMLLKKAEMSCQNRKIKKSADVAAQGDFSKAKSTTVPRNGNSCRNIPCIISQQSVNIEDASDNESNTGSMIKLIRDTTLSSIVIGWSVTIALALIYYLLATHPAAAK